MALLIEDGSNVVGADSLVTLDEIKAYAESRGKTIADDDTELEQQARNAMDFMITLETQYKGTRTYPGQALPFPRTDFWLYDIEQAINFIPPEAKKVQMQLVVEQSNGVDLFPTTQGQQLRSKTTGPLSSEWFAPPGSPIMRSVEAYLSPLLRNSFSLTTVRV